MSLPVFVVNSKGEAWAGLEKEDFQLWDDGKAVPVVAFQYIDTTSAEAQEAVRDLPAARRHFLFLFDLSFTSTAGLKRAKDAAEDFVRTGLGDSDLAAVATFDVSRGTRLIANFSDDRFLLLHAIETLGVPFLTRIHDPLNLAASLDRPDVPLRVSTGSTGDSATQSFLRTLAAAMRATDDRVYREHVLGFTRGLEGLGHSLAAVEGRKQILLFSAGFDPQTLVGTVSSSTARTDSEAVTGGRLWEVSEERFGDITVRGVLSTLVRTLSSSDCVLHTLDVTGLGGARDVQEKAAAQSLERQDNGRESLSYLAAETGGRFFSNTNDLRAPLREVDAMTNRYYILGYQPDDLRGPGHFHKLRVRVNRKGVKVSHRVGFFEGAPIREQTGLEKKFSAAQLLMTGFGPNSVHFSAICLPFPNPGADRETLGVVLQVPKGEVSWKNPLPVEVYGYAVGDGGTVVDHVAQFAQVDPAAADPKGAAEGLSLYGTFELPAGHYILKFMILVRDTDETGVQFLDVTIPPHEPRSGFLLPPVLLDEASRWLSLNMGAGVEGRPAFPLTAAGEALVPRASFRIVPGATQKLALVAFEPEHPTDPAAGVEIESSVVDKAGQVFSGGPLRITRVDRKAPGRQTFFLDFLPDPLPPGDYTLRVGLQTGGGGRLESYTLLRIASP